MKVEHGGNPSEWASLVLEAFREAVKLEIDKHWAAGRKVPVMKDGKLEWVGPGDMAESG